MSDIYCQLIQNFDDTNEFYDCVPRLGAFEISFNGVLIFSKCLSGCWPNFASVAHKCAQIAQAFDQGQDISVFQTNGQVVKAKRGRGNQMRATGGMA